MTWRRVHRAAAARFSASPSFAGGTAPARCPHTRVSLAKGTSGLSSKTHSDQPRLLAEHLTHVCTSRCNPGGAGVLSWCPPTCTWWRRVRRTCRKSCCPSHKPAAGVKVQHERHRFRRLPPRPRQRLRTYMIVLVDARRTLSRFLARTPGLVVRVQFAHLTSLARKVVTRICRRERPE